MSLTIGKFILGWFNRGRHELIKDEAVYRVIDLSIDELGTLICRNLHGEEVYFKTQTFTSPVIDVFQIDVEGENKRLVFYRVGSNLYCWNSVTGATRTLSTAMSGSAISYTPILPILSDSTHIYITDGITQMVDNGSTNTTWGIDPPEGVPVIKISSSDGNLTVGDYKYVYTFYDDITGSESDPGPACSALSVANNDAIDISNIETSPNSRVTSRRIYRTVASGGTYYYVAKINDNVTKEYTDIIADSSLLIALIDDQGAPPDGDVVFAFKNTLLLAGSISYPNRVYFCLPSKPDNFPSTYWVEAGTQASTGRIVNIAMFDGQVYFVHTKGFTRLIGASTETYNTYTTTNTRADIGTNARWSVAVGRDGIYFLTVEGIYRFDSVKTDRVSESIGRIFELRAGQWYDVIDRDTVASVARGVFLGSTYYLLIPMKSINGTVSNKILTYELVTQNWLLHDIDAQFIHGDLGRMLLYGSMYTYGSTTNYTVYELFNESSSTVDLPSPEFVTKSFDMTDIGDYSTARKEVVSSLQVKGKQTIGWLSMYRVDADGDWELTFYVDEQVRYTIALTNLSASTRNTWRRFPTKIKGTFIYVKAVATGSLRPDSCKFREIEVK